MPHCCFVAPSRGSVKHNYKQHEHVQFIGQQGPSVHRTEDATIQNGNTASKSQSIVNGVCTRAYLDNKLSVRNDLDCVAKCLQPEVLIKIAEIILGTIGIGLTLGFSTTFSFFVICDLGDKNFTVEETIAYDFNLYEIHTRYDSCEGNVDVVRVDGDFSVRAKFFVAVGIIASVISIIALILYFRAPDFIIALPFNFRAPDFIKRLTIHYVDIGLHVTLTVLWLAVSITWAVSVSEMSVASTLTKIISENKDLCYGNDCIPEKEASFTGLTVSIVFGFINLISWGINIVLLFKEKLLGATFISGTEPSGVD